jgi:hypothetical protein
MLSGKMRDIRGTIRNSCFSPLEVLSYLPLDLGEAELAAQQAYALDQLDPGVYHLQQQLTECTRTMSCHLNKNSRMFISLIV